MGQDFVEARVLSVGRFRQTIIKHCPIYALYQVPACLVDVVCDLRVSAQKFIEIQTEFHARLLVDLLVRDLYARRVPADLSDFTARLG